MLNHQPAELVPGCGRGVWVFAIMVLAATMSGCTQLAEVGEPANVPPRQATEPAYPAVHDMPPTRDTKPLTAEERQRIAEELSALRKRQEAETASDPAKNPPAQ